MLRKTRRHKLKNRPIWSQKEEETPMCICDLHRQKLDSDLGYIVSIPPLHKRRLINKKKGRLIG